MSPMFTETPYPIQPLLSRQNDKNIVHPNILHEMQARLKSNQNEKATFTTIPHQNITQSKIIQPLVQTPSTLLHTFSISQTVSCPVEEKENIQHENVEYLDCSQNDCNIQQCKRVCDI